MCIILYMCKYSLRVTKSKVVGIFHFYRECQVALQKRLTVLHSGGSFSMLVWQTASEVALDGEDQKGQSVPHQTWAQGFHLGASQQSSYSSQGRKALIAPLNST